MKKQILSGFVIAVLLFLHCFSVSHGEQKSNADRVVSAVTPVDTTRGSAIWTRSFAESKNTTYNSIPILTDAAIYVVNASTLYELSYKDGSIMRQLPLGTKMNSVCNMVHYNDRLYIPLNGGKMVCVDIPSMTMLWQSEEFGGQSLSTVLCHNGYLYAGSTTIQSSGTTGIFYCLDTSDGSVKWTYEDTSHPGGYYWSGGIIRGDALYFTGDNGILVSHSLLSDKVYDTYSLTNTAKIRAGLIYSGENNALYTVSNDGMLYQIRTTDRKVSDVKAASIVPGSDFINCTSTPVICNNRMYVGCIADGYGCVSVLGPGTLSAIYCSYGPRLAEVKSSPLVSTRGGTSGKVWVYFSANIPPGGLYYIEDQPGCRAADWQTLYTPATAKQYCMSDIVSGADGTLYYSNDSGTLFAVRETDLSPGSILPQTSPDTHTTVQPSPDSAQKKALIHKPEKPKKIKISRKKKKGKKTAVIRWKKADSRCQTVIVYRYGKGDWKKKIIKKKTKISFSLKKKKRLCLKLKCRKKQNGKWYYSGNTKTFYLRY